MYRYIALLRGINVGGSKKILMADLKVLLEALGLKQVTTYIQSGNVVFSSETEVSSELITEAIRAKYEWEVPVLLKSASEIESILKNCPFPKEKKEKSYFMLLFEPPSAENIKATLYYQFPDEEYAITPECVYFYCANGYGRAKLNNNFLEKKLKVTATSRNFRTLNKLLQMVASLD